MIFLDLVDLPAGKSFFIIKTECEQGGTISSRAAPDASPSGSSAFSKISSFYQAENEKKYSLPTPINGNPPPAAAGECSANIRKKYGVEKRYVSRVPMGVRTARPLTVSS